MTGVADQIKNAHPKGGHFLFVAAIRMEAVGESAGSPKGHDGLLARGAAGVAPRRGEGQGWPE